MSSVVVLCSLGPGLNENLSRAALAHGYMRAWGRWLWPTGLIGPIRPAPHGFSLSMKSGTGCPAMTLWFSMALDQCRLLVRRLLGGMAGSRGSRRSVAPVLIVTGYAFTLGFQARAAPDLAR